MALKDSNFFLHLILNLDKQDYNEYSEQSFTLNTSIVCNNKTNKLLYRVYLLICNEFKLQMSIDVF